MAITKEQAHIELAQRMTLVARNCNEIALMTIKDGFQYDLESRSRREDVRSLVEIAEWELGEAKKQLGEMGIKYSTG